MMTRRVTICSFFFFNDTATTEIYTLSLHDALPISMTRGLKRARRRLGVAPDGAGRRAPMTRGLKRVDRKSTRLNSSHLVISYAVFCLKKKKKQTNRIAITLTVSPPPFSSVMHMH